MTWYGHELVLLISISKAPTWFPSSPAWHHDLHHRVAIGVVTPTMLLLLLLPISNKVKHCIALNDWHACHTIIKDNPMAPAGCRIHRHASRDKLLQNMIISYIKYISSCLWPYHITTYPTKTSKTSSNLLLHVLRGCYGYLARTILTHAKPQWWYTSCYFTFYKDHFCRIRFN